MVFLLDSLLFIAELLHANIKEQKQYLTKSTSLGH